MVDIPWLSRGQKAVVLSNRVPAIYRREVRIVDFTLSQGSPYPEVRVEFNGREYVLSALDIVGSSFKSSHRCRRLADGLIFFEWNGYENNSNTVLLGEDHQIIVDSGHFHLLGSLLKSFYDENIPSDRIRAAIYTHCHPDHFDSSAVFYHNGIKVGLNYEERKYLLEMGQMLFRWMGVSLPEIEYDISLDEGEQEIEGLKLRIFQTPGHSPGSVCIYWKEKRVMCCGDVVFPGGAFGRCDFPGGSYKVLLESFSVFDGLDMEFLLSGHGPAIIGKSEVFDSINDSRNNLRSIIFSPW